MLFKINMLFIKKSDLRTHIGILLFSTNILSTHPDFDEGNKHAGILL